MHNGVLDVISLGAGVQSTTLALMAAHGLIRSETGDGDAIFPDAAIFADTGWESAAVYKHLAWLESVLPFPVYRVRREGPDLGAMALDAVDLGAKGRQIPPYHLAAPTGMIGKQCSKEFKARPVLRKIRAMLGVEPGKRATFKGIAARQWLGISLDEAARMKPSESRYVLNRFPLVEMRMSRRDCLKWIAEAQYPTPPKSSCIFCPFKSPAQWRDMRDHAPNDWRRAVEFDEAIRPGFKGMEGRAYLVAARVPLAELDLSTVGERGQADLFDNDCEGVCGL